MSVVAWDGKTLAADCQSECAGLRERTHKIFRLSDGRILAFTGDQDVGLLLKEWVEEGEHREKWPPRQKSDEWTRVIIASSAGVVIYEMEPIAQPVESEFMAWGGGRDYALGAMARGATAREAVEIAIRFCIHCGFGVEAYDLEDS